MRNSKLVVSLVAGLIVLVFSTQTQAEGRIVYKDHPLKIIIGHSNHVLGFDRPRHVDHRYYSKRHYYQPHYKRHYRDYGYKYKKPYYNGYKYGHYKRDRYYRHKDRYGYGRSNRLYYNNRHYGYGRSNGYCYKRY